MFFHKCFCFLVFKFSKDGGLHSKSFGFGEGLPLVNEDRGVLWFHFLFYLFINNLQQGCIYFIASCKNIHNPPIKLPKLGFFILIKIKFLPHE